jgi:hypothetical protein
MRPFRNKRFVLSPDLVEVGVWLFAGTAPDFGLVEHFPIITTDPPVFGCIIRTQELVMTGWTRVI